jgi:5-methyltetrahydropteroyltriglutamate--homocysteine methyltransferase
MGKTSWITYLYERVSGLEARLVTLDERACSRPAATASSSRAPTPSRRARRGCHPLENSPPEGTTRDDDPVTGEVVQWVCTGPITYDRSALDRIANLKAALSLPGRRGIPPVVAPASAYWLTNEHYASDEVFIYDFADALYE